MPWTSSNPNSEGRPDIVSTINYTVIAYSVGGIGISMFSFVISNLHGYGVADISSIKANLFWGFTTSSFLVVGTIFGTILLVLAIMVNKYGNPVRRLFQRPTSP
jgi:heme/copper-type cytochrome/quinol oxidase subunit 2